MAELVWDEIDERVYQVGVDRGVICHIDPIPGVAWNGLVSVQENEREEIEDIYFNGMKVYGVTHYKDYSAEVSAISYPKELFEYSGNLEMQSGFYIADQQPRQFNFSYRTRIGTPADQAEEHYKIHLVYNAIALPQGVSSKTLNNSGTVQIHKWKIETIPLSIHEPTFKAPSTSHFVIDTRKISEAALGYVEALLYGKDAPPEFEFTPWMWDPVYMYAGLLNAE